MAKVSERLIRTAEVAGYYLAYAVWFISDDETLDPFVVLERSGATYFHRINEERRAVDLANALGTGLLAEEFEKAEATVLVYTAATRLRVGPTDALFARLKVRGPIRESFGIAVPYARAASPSGFTIHRPKFDRENLDRTDQVALGMACYRGVNSHPEGAEIWNRHLDQRT